MNRKLQSLLCFMFAFALVVNLSFFSSATQTSSATSVSCSPGSVSSLQKTTCTATVTGNSPGGTITWQSSSTGSFSAASCTLAAGACSVTFAPSTSGLSIVTASYGGDVNNLGSYGSFNLEVSGLSALGTRSFFDGFETYPSGSNIPSGSSIFLQGNNAGWLFTSSCSSVLTGAVSTYQPYDGLQDFSMEDASTSCTSGNDGTLDLTVIATSAQIVATIFAYSSSTNLEPELLVSGGSLTVLSTSGSWIQLSSVAPATIGSTYTVQLSCSVQSATSDQICLFDDVNLYGAVLKNNPTNLAMDDYSGSSPYNIVGYSGASAMSNAQTILTYKSSPQKILTNVTAPDLDLPYTSANSSLLTVWVNSQYYRSIIPTSNSMTMYLDAPNLVNSYNFQFQNPNSILANNDPVYFSLNGKVITSGYLDSSFSFPAWLRAGTYNILITNTTGYSLYSSSVTISPSGNFQTPYQIVVVNQTSSYQSTTQAGISIGEELSGTSLIASFQDSTNATSLVNTTLYLRTTNGGSTVLGGVCIATYVKTGCAEVTKIGIATSSYVVQVNETGQMYFIFAFNQSDKITTIGPYTVQGGSALGNTQGGADNCILGCIGVMLGSAFNSQTSVLLDIISVAIVVTIAAALDGRYANFGVLILAIVTGSLYAAGWINLGALGIPTGAIAIMAILAVLGMGAEKEKQAETLFETGG